MKNRRKRKRKSRIADIRARTSKAHAVYAFMSRISQVIPGGNPFGLGEWTLYMARGPERV